MTSIRRLLIGKRLETKDLPHQSISKPVGLAVFASDALSSTAYATQEILIILSYAAVGATGATLWANSGTILGMSWPIALAIAVLLAIVTISYRQTIYAYPNGGGAYIVARDNLGEAPAQVAGAALLTDYILTVAVSISSGVAQIVSAFPDLLPYRVYIAVGVIGIMTLVNLRGVKESGRIFAVPTYFFVGTMFLTLIVALVRHLFGGGLPLIPDISPDIELVHHGVTESLGVFLVLRAFSSGCTALTGIEAISNGITAFKEPRSKNAATTLIWMSTILITLFLGITFIANQIHAVPSEIETVISQLGRAVYGDGTIMYFLLLAGTALILLMAANTSYADFPRLAALSAGDGFLPRQLTQRGSRLVFSWGILVLGGFASVLVVIFDASTTALIPLYAIGVFLSFTISQTGMVIHLNRMGKLKPGESHKTTDTTLEYDAHWRTKQIISAVGAVCTFVVMIVFAVTKFRDGAWFIVVLIPTLVFIFFRIHRHYKEVAHALSLKHSPPVDVKPRSSQTLILIDNVHAQTVQMVNFAKSLGHPWHAVHVSTNPERTLEAQRKWKEKIGEGEMVVIESPYRLLAEPLRDYLISLRADDPDDFIHIIMGHLVMDTFWEQALHQNSALLLSVALAPLDHVVVTLVPYQIHHMDGEIEMTSEQHKISLPTTAPAAPAHVAAPSVNGDVAPSAEQPAAPPQS